MNMISQPSHIKGAPGDCPGTIARSGVSIAVQSLRWLVAARKVVARRRCGALKLHLEVETGVGRHWAGGATIAYLDMI